MKWLKRLFRNRIDEAVNAPRYYCPDCFEVYYSERSRDLHYNEVHVRWY